MLGKGKWSCGFGSGIRAGVEGRSKNEDGRKKSDKKEGAVASREFRNCLSVVWFRTKAQRKRARHVG
ncbi:hypothetical protein EYF80_008973 [Liparis tanakae]|uniref:Uncharacterized protein n=1 Tax=Liparis tanakae TaxID=230148 RepID=A0A4Z2IRU7_9TELE|nr:hypothetical protein EYF80_008973 [Liparis tanakae]